MEMAKKETVTLVSDLSKEIASETVDFAVGGKAYEIDLTGAEAAQLRLALAPFVAAARPVKGGAARKVSGGSGSVTSISDRKANKEKREVLRSLGFGVADRGKFTDAQDKAYTAHLIAQASGETSSPAPAPEVATEPVSGPEEAPQQAAPESAPVKPKRAPRKSSAATKAAPSSRRRSTTKAATKAADEKTTSE